MKFDRPRACTLIDNALTWLHEYSRYFDPARECFDDPALSQKMLLELMIMCMVYRRLAPDVGSEPDGRSQTSSRRIDQFIALAQETFHQTAFRHRIMRYPHRYRLHGLTALTLKCCDVADEQLTELIQRSLGLNYTNALEELPFRNLERQLMRAWLETGHVGQIAQPATTLDPLPAYRSTLAARADGAIYLTSHDAYAVTHTLFYLGHFGTADARIVVTRAGPDAHQRLCLLLESLLGIYMRQRHLDLVGELVLSCHCVRWYESPLLAVAVDQLISAQRPDGSVPGPHFMPDRMAQLPKAEREPYYVKHNYHTTLVAILALSTLVASDLNSFSTNAA